MSYAALHVHSHFSLLDGLSKPWQIAARAVQLGMPACAITDHGNVSGAVDFIKAMQSACKNCGYQPNQHAKNGKGKCTIKGTNCEQYTKHSIKAILGNEFYVSRQDSTIKNPENRSNSHLCVLAKNLKGWKNLVKATSASNHPDNFYYKPRLDIEKLASFSEGQWIVFSGHPGSTFADFCFTDIKAAYSSRTYEKAKEYVKPWPQLQIDLLELVKKYQKLFGQENVFVEVQLIDAINLPAAEVLGKIMRWLGKEGGIHCVATPDAHYPESKDAEDQRILLCSNLDGTLAEAESKLAKGEDFGLSGFFRSNKYHIPSFEELEKLHTKEELDATLTIANMCESYDITSKPKLPPFPCPNNLSPDDYMTELCRVGWTKRLARKIGKNEELKKVYAEQVKKELAVLKEADLATYFLIVADIIDYSVKIGCKKSYGRGSGAGTLVGYLLGIHDTDPIKFKLSFDRFYSSARNDKASGRISMPDYDMDFPKFKREEIVEYIKEKYGKDNVGQIATFGRMQGRDALTSVFKAHSWSTFEERKLITSFIPDAAEISDELQEMMEETGEASIIRWTLEHGIKELEQYCKINKETGELEGELARYFEQAIRLEGTKKVQSKHAAGIVIFPEPLADNFPLLYDKNSDMYIVSMEMSAIEACGGLKMDCLGVAALDKCMGTIRTIATGKVGIA